MNALPKQPRDRRPRGGFWRDAGPSAGLLAVLAAAAVGLHLLGRPYLLVFAMNVSMVTLALTLLIFHRYRDWRVLPLALLFFWITLAESVTSATEILGLRPAAWVTWLASTPLVVPTLLGFAAVVYLWRVFQVQADLQARERDLAERARQAQRLESLGVLASGVAHDFNTLLTTILGNTALVLMDVPADSETATAARSIQTAAERAAAISRQMLDYSGCGRFRLARLTLPALLARLEPLLRAGVPSRVRLCLEPPEGAPPVVEVDTAQCEQLVVNLVTNAAEAIRGEGAIRVRAGAVQADAAMLLAGVNSDVLPPGPYATLTVEDTGDGLDDETRQRMFDPFFSTRGVGRGMGLAVVLGIVRGHRGTILVDSRPGRGTRMTVLLPALEDPTEPPDPTTRTTP
ncbi:MAG: hypothetical protein GX595_10185 [Lentisphaerae bacterium]|nr:hypothetical protein [Lentisphaerota bacterium]